MLDVDTFLTTLYVTVEDFCHSRAPKSKPAPEASLCASEVITLSIFARWSRFNSERDFYRYADTELRDAFPTLPNRSQFNHLVRSCAQLIEAFALHLTSLLTEAQMCPYQALDSSAMPVRDAKRRGAGWLAGYAYTSVGLTAWDGTRALACSLRSIPRRSLLAFLFRVRFHRRAATGGDFLRREGSTKREAPQCRFGLLETLHSLPKGFEGTENHLRWLENYGAHIIHPPKRNSRKKHWSKRLRRWVAAIRQIIESVYDKLFNTFGLWRERPHELSGLRARLAARVALHNFCIWPNEQLGRPRLALADLLGWGAHVSHQAFNPAEIAVGITTSAR
jgi:hypothetical protein